MKFFKKTSVAILLTALLVALCCVWGYSRAYEASHSDPDSVVQSQRAGESGLNYFLNWIDDGAGLFSMETTDTLARNNLDLNNTYGCLLALKTVNYLNGQDIASYSKDLFQQVDLGRKVRAGVLFLGHRERNDLRIAQVAVAVCLVDTLREHLGVVAARIDVLALLADHDGRTGILTGRQLALGGDRLIEQHRIGDELVVVGRFRIVQNARQFLQMRRAQVERHVGDRLARQQFQPLGGHLQNAAAVAFDRFHVILRKQAVFRRILRQRERFLINEFSHIISVLKIPHGQR